LAEVDLRLLRSIPHCGHARRFRRRRTGAGQEQVVDQHRHLVPGATTAHPPVPSGPRRRLTPEGREVLNATDDLLRDIDRFRDRINIASGVLSGRFALHVIDNILIYGKPASSTHWSYSPPASTGLHQHDVRIGSRYRTCTARRARNGSTDPDAKHPTKPQG
jgi:hypothetical protein